MLQIGEYAAHPPHQLLQANISSSTLAGGEQSRQSLVTDPVQAPVTGNTTSGNLQVLRDGVNREILGNTRSAIIRRGGRKARTGPNYRIAPNEEMAKQAPDAITRQCNNSAGRKLHRDTGKYKISNHASRRAQGPGLHLVPHNNLVEIIGAGRSFHFTFNGDFIDRNNMNWNAEIAYARFMLGDANVEQNGDWRQWSS